MNKQIRFEQLNIGWNAEPNAPELHISVNESNVVIAFFLNYFSYAGFTEKSKAKIIFHNCYQYRIGAPNDEGFYIYNQSRYKKYGVKWGEFYLIHNSDWQQNFPNPIQICTPHDNLQHYLFYFRDETFECIASSYSIDFC
ncbi:MAG: hypothetical protein J6C33_06960 [Lachnospiraceae bacterium]|nr:hypothetical protein [Lachnospiraceae bacterium]